jgi:hypothetical protein
MDDSPKSIISTTNKPQWRFGPWRLRINQGGLPQFNKTCYGKLWSHAIRIGRAALPSTRDLTPVNTTERYIERYQNVTRLTAAIRRHSYKLIFG